MRCLQISGAQSRARAPIRARLYLAKALQLAPNNDDYRRELFQFLIVSDHSPGALHLAENIIQMTPESDPDYPFMQLQWDAERGMRCFAEYRVEAALSFLPQRLARMSRTPVAPVREGKSIVLLAEALR